MIAVADKEEEKAKADAKGRGKNQKPFDAVAVMTTFIPEMVGLGQKLEKKSSEMLEKAKAVLKKIENAEADCEELWAPMTVLLKRRVAFLEYLHQ